MAMELYDLQVNTLNIHNKLSELGNSLQKEQKNKKTATNHSGNT